MVEDYHYNPEDSSIKNGKLEYAIDNVKHLLADIDLEGVKFARDEKSDDGRGRFGFVIWKENHAYPIIMPGSPLRLIRHMPPHNPSPLQRPLDIRDYLGCSSWWDGLVESIGDELEGKGYNPVIEDLECEIEELKKQVQDLSK